MTNAISLGISNAAALMRYSFSLVLTYSLDLSLSSIAAVEMSALASPLRIPMLCCVDATGLWQLLCGAFDAPAHAWSDDHHNVVGFHHLLEGHDLHVMRALDAVV